MNEHLLSLTIWIPIVGALLVVLAPKTATKGIATLASAVAMLVSVLISFRFHPVAPVNLDAPGFQFTEKYKWIQSFNIEYFLGVDGISVTMVLLTGILSFICILASYGFEHWNTNRGIKGYFALFLLLEAGMM